MQTAWCPICSHPNPYESIRPKRCAKCDETMTTAFLTTPVSQPPGTPQKVVIASEQFTAPPLRRPQPLYSPQAGSPDERGPDDHYNPASVQNRAAQLTASLRGGFNIGLNDEALGNHVKLGTLGNVRNAFSQAEAAETGGAQVKKTRSRKR